MIYVSFNSEDYMYRSKVIYYYLSLCLPTSLQRLELQCAQESTFRYTCRVLAWFHRLTTIIRAFRIVSLRIALIELDALPLIHTVRKYLKKFGAFVGRKTALQRVYL